MKNVIQFQINKENTGYSAFAVNYPIVTQAETLDDLQSNIKEATELYFDDDSDTGSGLSSGASIFMNYEMPVYA